MAKDMLDLEKGMEEGVHAPAHQAPGPMAEGEEQEHLILEDLHIHGQIEGGAVAAEMNPRMKWLPYWLLVAATSVIVLTNHIHAALKYQLIPPELAMFVVFLCAMCLVFRAMKQKM